MKQGRPQINNELLRARVDTCVAEALDAFAQSQNMSRPEAIRAVLADWLRTHGYKLVFPSNAKGPATDAVAAMDKAISEHRAKR